MNPHTSWMLAVVMVGLLGTAATAAAAAPPDRPSDALLERLEQAQAHLFDPEDPDVVVIEDDAHNLDRVLRALRDLGTGRQGRWKVRVALYGDSNHINDQYAASLRQSLGAVFGHGGHGFVAGARPWDWYQHTEIRLIRGNQRWEGFATTSPKAKRPLYGHAGIVGVASGPGASVEYRIAEPGPDAGIEDNRRIDHAELFYVCEPHGGNFEVLVDGQPRMELSAACPQQRLGRAIVPLEDGTRSIKIVNGRGRLTFLGAAFENDRPGIIVDGLGVGALNLPFILDMDEALFIESMRARAYDLVILHTGSNMWAPVLHPGYMKDAVARIRRALGPDVSILILSPPDFTRHRTGPDVGHKRMGQCRDEKRALARKHDLAFWDFYEEMGGRGSIMDWYRKKMVRNDLVHFRPPFQHLMMRRLARALLRHMAARLHDLERAPPDVEASAPAR